MKFLEDIMISAKNLILTNDVTWLDSITISDPNAKDHDCPLIAKG